MKRRLFLKGILGASVVAPVVIKAVTREPFTDKVDGWVETGELPEMSLLPKGLLTPQKISNEALTMLNADLEKGDIFTMEGKKFRVTDISKDE